MKKTILSIGLVLLSVMAVVSAGYVSYFGRITTTVDIDRSVTLTGSGCTENECTDTMNLVGGESGNTPDYTIQPQGSVEGTVKMQMTSSPSDGGIEDVTTVYKLHAEGTAPREQRIKVKASDIGIDTLSDLDTISWNQNVVEGYAGHVDVLIDTDGDGVSDDALVFEYAKVDNTNCDNAPYPTGELYTFGDKGIVDGNAYAWLSSGDAGYCGSPTYYSHSLSDWKSGQTENSKSIDANTKIIALDFEIDSWIATTTVELYNIKVNGNAVNKIRVEPNLNILFYNNIKSSFGAEGSYQVLTEVIPQ